MCRSQSSPRARFSSSCRISRTLGYKPGEYFPAVRRLDGFEIRREPQCVMDGFLDSSHTIVRHVYHDYASSLYSNVCGKSRYFKDHECFSWRELPLHVIVDGRPRNFCRQCSDQYFADQRPSAPAAPQGPTEDLTGPCCTAVRAPQGPTEDLSRRPQRSEKAWKTRYRGDLTIVASRRLKRPQYLSPRRPRDRFEPKDTDGAKSVSPTPGTPNSGACSQTGASSCNRIRRPSQHMCEDWEEETEEETKKRERLSVPHNS